jgi:two-component system OmpR family response regulator
MGGTAMNDRPQVLVIDDDVELAEMYRLALERDGWEVVLAHDGTSGIKRAFTLPDLVVLDVQMPPAGGVAVLDAIRCHPVTADLPVVMFSNRDEVETIESAAEHGATDYLVKAQTPPALLSRCLRSTLREEQRLSSCRFSAFQRTLDLVAGAARKS